MKKIRFLTTALAMACVSSSTIAQTCITNTPNIHEEGNFIDRKDGTILDVSTGLIWAKCNVGEKFNADENSCSGSPINFTTWQDALNAASDSQNTTIGETSGFRMPNIKELTSIVDYQCISPSIDTKVFISALNAPYWSNTPDVHNVNVSGGYEGLLIDFKDGQEVDSGASGMVLMRMVKHISD